MTAELTRLYVDRPETVSFVMPTGETMFDPLTGLLSEAGINNVVDQLITRSPGNFSQVEMDLHLLKDVNEEYGHTGGDRYISTAATVLKGSEVLQELLRTNMRQDTLAVGRRHGDEFAIVLPGVNTQEAVASIIVRLQAELEDHGIGASMGGRPHSPGESRDALKDAADELAQINDLRNKLETHSSSQLIAALRIGEIAAAAGLNLRTVPAILRALSHEQVPSDDVWTRILTHSFAPGSLEQPPSLGLGIKLFE